MSVSAFLWYRKDLRVEVAQLKELQDKLKIKDWVGFEFYEEKEYKYIVVPKNQKLRVEKTTDGREAIVFEK